MAKKKKTQMKPVARGFATTSVPKKALQLDNPESGGIGMVAEVDPEPEVATSLVNEIIGPDEEKTEEQSLQDLVDKYQEKTEKEVARAIKAIESDRRLSMTLPHLKLDPVIVDRIFALLLEHSAAKKSLDESEDKAIARVGVTFGVLRRLGMSESRVEECLHAIQGVDLDEAYEWLYLHCSEDVLEPRGNPGQKEAKTPTDQNLRTPTTPRTPAEFLALTGRTAAKNPIQLNANAPAFVPENLDDANIDKAEEQDIIKTRILTSLDDGLSTSDPGSDSPASDDPAVLYARTKLELENLARKGSRAENDHLAIQAHDLQKRLKALKDSYFFDEKEAEAVYRTQRSKFDAMALRDRLRSGTGLSSTETPLETRKNQIILTSRSGATTLPPLTSPPPDVFDDADWNSSAGGILELLDTPVAESNNHGKTTIMRDMSFPKHWSGRTPKALLQDAVARIDRYAAIGYTLVSGESRAKRASVHVRWDGRKMDEWVMEDVACPDEGQAEQYISTVALHSLTFPPIDGFAANAVPTTSSQTSFRQLPAVFRDLWGEFEVERKAREDTINRRIWSKLRAVIHAKLDRNVMANDKGDKPVVDIEASHIPKPLAVSEGPFSEQLAADFGSRQASPEYQAMLAQRNTLPIAQYRTRINRILEESQVLVLSGETGCGKSTQVPTFILEDHLSHGKPCKIYCTEPRRISAMSLAQRVSRELGDPPNAIGTNHSLVGYSIRLESNMTRNTRLAFITNGIALRMLEGGSGQNGYGTAFNDVTHIIIDEVHERTIESDFLLIVLKSLLKERPDLRVILMSATVDAEKISDFFGGCPMLHVPGRTFPVKVNYLEDAIDWTGWSISESSAYAKYLDDKYHRGKPRGDWTEETVGGEDDDDEIVPGNIKLEKRYSATTIATINILDERLIPYDLIILLLERICFGGPSYRSYSTAILIFMPGLAEIRRLNDMLSEHHSFGDDNHFVLYPLHSTLSSENQSAVFDIPPPGVRKIVISTNIAETGLTIPDITCVIDTGKHREMRFDEKRQISRLVETFIAKSNAAQRRGRAGRVRNGLCFHLFTKLRHDTQMADHPLPEMTRLSLSDLALRIKVMKLNLGSSIEDILSRALDPPAAINVQRAVSMLVEVRALTPLQEITPMGRLLSKLPTDVHLGKFLLIATLFRCLDPALTVAAALNSKSPFVSPFGLEHEADRARQAFKIENSDFLTIHNAFSSWRKASANPSSARKFCRIHYLSYQNLLQIEELRQQFLGYLIDSSFIQVDRAFVRDLTRARYSRNRVRFVNVPPELDSNSGNPSLINAALAAGLFPKILALEAHDSQLKTISNNQAVSFHPSSINFGVRPSDFGISYLAYFTLMHSRRLYARETGPVDDIALLLLCGECDFKIISNTAIVDRKIKFHISPKSNIALKFLRGQLGSLLAHQYRGKPLQESELLWKEIAIMVLGKFKVANAE